MIPYVRPTVNLTAKYEFTSENKIDIVLSVQGKFFNDTFGVKQNKLTTGYRYKTNDGTFSEWIFDAFTINLANKNEYMATLRLSDFDYKNAYTFAVCVKDELVTNWVHSVEKVVKALPVFDWSKEDFNFNVPVKINNKEVKDFVIAYGYSGGGVNGGWHYRIWNSGFKECWGYFRNANINVDKAWGSIYYSDPIGGYPYPVNFANFPYEQVSVTCPNSVSFVTNTNNTETNANSIYITRPDLVGTISWVDIHYYSCGY